VLVGSADAIRPVVDLHQLAELVDLSHISRGPAKFDESELEHLNAKLVHGMPYDAVRERLAGFGILNGEAFWEAVKTNLTKVSDAAEWWSVVQGPLTPVIDDPSFAEKAAALLPPEPWDRSTWKAWTEAVKEATGLKGKALFMPLRRALTARDHGPELAALLPLIGSARARARLAGMSA
jgi:glutamyl-tRNA synthetase